MAYCPKCGSQLGMLDIECSACGHDFKTLIDTDGEAPEFITQYPDRLTIKDFRNSFGHTRDFWKSFRIMNLDLKRFVLVFLVLLPIIDTLCHTLVRRFKNLSKHLESFSGIESFLFSDPVWSAFLASAILDVISGILLAFISVLVTRVLMLLFRVKGAPQLAWKIVGVRGVIAVISTLLNVVFTAPFVAAKLFLPYLSLGAVGVVVFMLAIILLIVVMPWLIGLGWFGLREGLKLSIRSTISFAIASIILSLLVRLPIMLVFYKTLETVPSYALLRQRHSAEVAEHQKAKAAIYEMARRSSKSDSLPDDRDLSQQSFTKLQESLASSGSMLYLGALKSVDADSTGKTTIGIERSFAELPEIDSKWTTRKYPDEIKCVLSGAPPTDVPDTKRLASLRDDETGIAAVISLKPDQQTECQAVLFLGDKFGAGDWQKAYVRSLENQSVYPFEFRLACKSPIDLPEPLAVFFW